MRRIMRFALKTVVYTAMAIGLLVIAAFIWALPGAIREVAGEK